MLEDFCSSHKIAKAIAHLLLFSNNSLQRDTEAIHEMPALHHCTSSVIMAVKIICCRGLTAVIKNLCPCSLAVIVVEVFYRHDLRLVEAPPAGKVLVVFGQLSGQGLHGWSAGCNHDVLLLLLASSGGGQKR